MLDDLRPLPPDSPEPRPGDIVHVRPGTPYCDPATPYTVADTDASGTLVLYLPSDHPGYWDWAAPIEPAAAQTVTRFGCDGPRTWPAPR
uniref:DUF6211 family protein n=1 Tax=unclassified Streptomyces TaxID=2593676 RepID=UPI003F4926D9